MNSRHRRLFDADFTPAKIELPSWGSSKDSNDRGDSHGGGANYGGGGGGSSSGGGGEGGAMAGPGPGGGGERGRPGGAYGGGANQSGSSSVGGGEGGFSGADRMGTVASPGFGTVGADAGYGSPKDFNDRGPRTGASANYGGTTSIGPPSPGLYGTVLPKPEWLQRGLMAAFPGMNAAYALGSRYAAAPKTFDQYQAYKGNEQAHQDFQAHQVAEGGKDSALAGSIMMRREEERREREAALASSLGWLDRAKAVRAGMTSAGSTHSGWSGTAQVIETPGGS